MSHLDVFTIWYRMSGMAGESLKDLWELSKQPGSAALLSDIATLSARMKRLEKIREWRSKPMKEKPRGKP